MPAEKRSFLLYPCSQLKPICLDLCLDSEGTLSIGEGGAQRRHEGTRWSSASKGALAFFNLVSPLSIVLSVPSLLSPSIHLGLVQALYDLLFLFLFPALPPTMATRGRFVTRFWESQSPS